MKKININDSIIGVTQTSKFHDPKKAKLYSNLQEITLHFKLNQLNKDGGDLKLFYCQLKISSEAI
jgi:hypothetical protein